jgi:hypothetical protein
LFAGREWQMIRTNGKGPHARPFCTLRRARRRRRRIYAFLIFSSILKMPFDEPPKQTLVGFAETTALESVAAGAGSFCHGRLQSVVEPSIKARSGR